MNDLRRWMMLLCESEKQTLDEAAQSLLERREAPLFHFTANLRRVLADDALRPGNESVAVSLTRNVATPFYSYSAKPDRDCLVLNQTALASRFRILPSYGDSAERLPDLLRRHREEASEVNPADYVPKNEQEERVFGTIQPLSRYLLAIVVDDAFLSTADVTMKWVRKVKDDFNLIKIMDVGVYSKAHGIPVVERSALRPNGTWGAEITKPVQRAGIKLARRHAKDATWQTKWEQWVAQKVAHNHE